ncbi:hypothetical protein GF386_02440 [Candidatus Pacearchaeota archaeon]|nr:hypothetical protein [Candidatus Pacearchaeota archaeon]MBD3283003.1 hypothetical protein [Candidatus Pacearchaeota archaeon]
MNLEAPVDYGSECTLFWCFHPFTYDEDFVPDPDYLRNSPDTFETPIIGREAVRNDSMQRLSALCEYVVSCDSAYMFLIHGDGDAFCSPEIEDSLGLLDERDRVLEVFYSLPRTEDMGNLERAVNNFFGARLEDCSHVLAGLNDVSRGHGRLSLLATMISNNLVYSGFEEVLDYSGSLYSLPGRISVSREFTTNATDKGVVLFDVEDYNGNPRIVDRVIDSVEVVSSMSVY